MKRISKYVADDGTEFSCEHKCVAYEEDCAKIDEIMSVLKPRPETTSCRFENGGGFLKHLGIDVINVRGSLLKIAKKYTSHKWIQGAIDGTSHISGAGRLISELPHNREFGQPYFVSHPQNADLFEL
jgi:hypothetical protein